MAIKIKRIYEPYAPDDGYRILVDRLWPRGVKKEDARLDKWFKEIAPSTALRKWFNHEPGRWEQFRRKYHAELNVSAVLDELQDILRTHKIVTLLIAAKDERHNHALVLHDFIKTLAL